MCAPASNGILLEVFPRSSTALNLKSRVIKRLPLVIALCGLQNRWSTQAVFGREENERANL